MSAATSGATSRFISDSTFDCRKKRPMVRIAQLKTTGAEILRKLRPIARRAGTRPQIAHGASALQFESTRRAA